MSPASPPRLEGQPATPHHPAAAEPAAPPAAAGARKVVAEGVVSAVRPNPRPRDGRRPVAWLHICAPPDWQIAPTARSLCECGRDERAAGRARVAALVADHHAHPTACPLRTPAPERTAA
ncbi:hypothetical protein CAG99_14880 [Streptomyces marincola]|uniref:Uncharacterized protein n=1 Tax=Streptomyces marincola TaxID=2878388 RepID=A0A1W7CYP2_9ACTN|nr:hypothetical protein CAG99_14880 [Streptomyces marincola]